METSKAGTAGVDPVANNGLVSVVIPAYNAAQYIEKAVRSVLAQTHPRVEIIVVNDGSSDQTGEVVEREFGGRVTLVSQANGGLANARNAGIREATGEYVAFLDADDWWDPSKLEAQVRNLKANPDATANYTGLMVVYAESEHQSRLAPVEAAKLWPSLRWCNPGIPPSSVIIRRTALMELGGFTEGLRACEDWDLWFKVVRNGRFTVIEEPLTYYLMSPGGLSRDADRMFASFLEILEPLLLKDFKGTARALWKRRIVSYQAYKSSLTAREAGDKATERKYMWRSLREWPSPLWAPERFKSFAVTLLKT